MKAGTALLVVALVLGAWLVSPGLTDESAVSLQGDMPRYLMNAVFLGDALHAGVWSPTEAIDFAQRYFARYPALSLGHHPPLLPLLMVPVFEALGPSVFAGRITILILFLVSIVLVNRVGRRMANDEVAGWASLLFASTPLIVDFGQQVLSEVPAVAVVLVAFLLLLRFRETGRNRDFVGFVVAALAGLACRQTVAFVFPAFVMVMLRRNGLAQLRQPFVFALTLTGIVGVVAAAVATMIWSPFNTGVMRWVLEKLVAHQTWTGAIRTVVVENHAPGLFALGALGLGWSLWRRDHRIAPATWWFASVLGCAVTVTAEIAPLRYSVTALPALAILAASVIERAGRGRGHMVAMVATAVVVAFQTNTSRTIRPVGASGYEQAAVHVLAEAPGTAVLYSASVDTGYFTFFMRKHDPAQRSVVIRSDKLLTTSYMADISFYEQIHTPAEIYPHLDRLGIRFVVLEDRPSGSRVLDWLWDEARTPRFAERRRFPSNSTDPRLQGVSVVVYEYLGARPPAPDAAIELSLPLVSRQIRVPLGELLPR